MQHSSAMFIRSNPRRQYSIEVRSAQGGAWREIDTQSSLARARDAVIGAGGLINLEHGDLVRARWNEKNVDLAVMTSLRGLVRPPRLFDVSKMAERQLYETSLRQLDWVSFWEDDNEEVDPFRHLSLMMDVVDAVRVVDSLRALACCHSILEVVVQKSPYNSAVLEVLDAMLSFLHGDITKSDARKIGYSLMEYSDRLNRPSGMSAYDSRLAYVVGVVCANVGVGGAAFMIISLLTIDRNSQLFDRDLTFYIEIIMRSFPLPALLLALLGEKLPFQLLRSNP